MTQEEPKTMTGLEAWIAMANGECVRDASYVHQIKNNDFRFWNGEGWCACCELGEGPYSIVPDPSKPVEDEYEKDWFNATEDNFVRNLRALLEKWYVRKDK